MEGKAMTKLQGHYGKVKDLLEGKVAFEGGAVHSLDSIPEEPKVGDLLLIDAHGRKWIKL